jgi:hypothetical protein
MHQKALIETSGRRRFKASNEDECFLSHVLLYLCVMKNEIDIPVLKQEDFVAANIRRDNYSLIRDKQAMEFNGAIASRLLAEESKQVKCEKCGKEFATEADAEGPMKCPECK